MTETRPAAPGLRRPAQLVVGAVAGASLLAVATSPVFWSDAAVPEVFAPIERRYAVLPPAGGAFGDWDGEPTCVDDPAGDVVAAPSSTEQGDLRRVGGEGDLTRLCVAYGTDLVLELTMEAAVEQQEGDRDDARLTVDLDADENYAPDLSYELGRAGARAVVVDPAGREIAGGSCLPAATWRGTRVRVELRAGCLGVALRWGTHVHLGYHDLDDYTSRGDGLPDATTEPPGDRPDVPGTGAYDDLLRVSRYGGPVGDHPTPEAAIRSVVGDRYLGACRGLTARRGFENRVCSTAYGAGRYALLHLEECRPLRRVAVRRDPRTDGWEVVDADAPDTAPLAFCPFTDASPSGD